MRIASYILSAKELIRQYDGSLPFAAWSKNYFRVNKKFGSRDRKMVSHLCYSFFRLGGAFASLSPEERVGIGLFLSSASSNDLLEALNSSWSEKAALSPREKMIFLDAPDEWHKVFPLYQNISKEIDFEPFISSHFSQPHLYLRIRPGKEERVIQNLNAAAIPFTETPPYTIALQNTTNVEEVVQLDKEVVVQDLSSQQVLEPLAQFFAGKQNLSVWDCCAASGGKSILAYDILPHIHLTVSDIRSSILANLHNRFSRAGIKGYHSFVADIAAPQFVPAKKYDVVICDAPCSGSGTWSRTPEQLRFFNEEKLTYYSNLQKWIVLNASKAVHQQGALLYITCSVYAAENEDVVAYVQQNTNLKLQSMQYYKGYNRRADTLFAALFTL